MADAPIVKKGLYGQEYEEEPGLEEEGLFDVVKPYKQKAVAALRERGHPLAADALDVLGPDSPFSLIPTGGEEGALYAAIPKGAKAAHLPEVQKEMRAADRAAKAAGVAREVDTTVSPALAARIQAGREAKEIRSKMPDDFWHRQAFERGQGALAIKGYPAQEIDQAMRMGDTDRALSLHHEFRKKIPAEDTVAKVAHDWMSDDLQRRIAEDGEFHSYMKKAVGQ